MGFWRCPLRWGFCNTAIGGDAAMVTGSFRVLLLKRNSPVLLEGMNFEPLPFLEMVELFDILQIFDVSETGSRLG